METIKTEINRDKLVVWFMTNFNKKAREMVKSTHSVGWNPPNIWHAGDDSVWTHTMMVMTWIEAKKSEVTEDEYITLITSALLHDTGKPDCEEQMPASDTKPVRNSFKGHEGCSSFFAVGVLKKLKAEFPEIYTDKIIENVIKVVSLHGTYVDETTDILNLRMRFREADKLGAVRISDEGIFAQYEKRKYLKETATEKDKNLTVLIGLPNSGKSTTRDELIKENKDLFVISRDDLLEVFYEGKFFKVDSYNTMYKYVHDDKEVLKEFEELFRVHIQEAQKFKNVLIDMTQLSLSSRRKMLSNFPKFNKKALVIMTDNESLLERNDKRFKETRKFISEKVIENMMTSFTYPVLEEGFDCIELRIN